MARKFPRPPPTVIYCRASSDPAGALAASFLVSIAESLSVMVIPSQWQNLIAFAVMIVMLLVRPRGLFGRAVSR